MRVRPSALIIEDNRALLLHYNYGGVDVYAIPGGSPEGAETLEEANIRELREELSISVDSGRLILACETYTEEGGESVLHTVFSSTIRSGTPLIDPENTSSLGFVWREVSSLPYLNLYPDVGKNILEITCGWEALDGPFIGRVRQPWYE